MTKDLLSVSKARQQLLSMFSPVGRETVSLPQALGRVLPQNIVSEIDLPSFDNSSMDGFAVRSADVSDASLENPVRLTVVANISAGQVHESIINHSETARIMTGAPMPPGADAVVPVEDTDRYVEQTNRLDPNFKNVQIYRPAEIGEFVRPRGQDVKVGELVLKWGIKLRPQDVGYLATLGIAEVSVIKRPRIAIISTGDEVLPIGASLEPGKIYDSNAYSLSALVERTGGEPIYLGIAPDNEEAIHQFLDKAVSYGVDLILSTAGVSVGAFDYVRMVVEQYGKLSFWRVDMRPGKPLLFGFYRNIPIIGLPGNPVSAFVGFEVFVRPALLKLMGIRELQRPVINLQLLEPVESDGRESYLRAVVTSRGGNWCASLTGHQGSGNLYSLVQANALLIIPSGVKSLPIGAEVGAWLLDEV